MAHFYGKLFLLGFILPVCLIVSVIMRQTGFSFIYLVYYLIHPTIRVSTVLSLPGTARFYLLSLLIVSILILLAHCVFQLALALNSNIGAVAVEVLQNVGLVKLSEMNVLDACVFVAPDVIVFLCALWVNVVCNKSSIPGDLTSSRYSMTLSSLFHSKWVKTAAEFGKFLTLLMLCIAGGLMPSILNGVYFALFLGIMTWWAFYKELSYKFGILLHWLQLFIAMHTFVLLLFQSEFVLASIKPDSKFVRYFGLDPMIKVNKQNPSMNTYISDDIPALLNPIMLLILYYIISLEANLLLQYPRLKFAAIIDIRLKSMVTEKVTQGDAKILDNSNVTDETAETVGKRGTLQTEVTVKCLNSGHSMLTSKFCTVFMTSQKQPKVLSNKPAKQYLWSKVRHVIKILFRLFMRSSYIFMNLMMMIWSITFLSYLTVIFMLWSTITWSLPNHRQTMMQSSPIVMIYGEFLLVMQYLYGMAVMDEVPQLQAARLFQIGFVKVQKPVCIPIYVEAFYMTVCWITVHQFMMEKFYGKYGVDLSRPSRLDLLSGQKLKRHLTKKTVALVEYYLTKFWIWIVIILFVVVGISGKNVILIRILYAILLLIFLLTFQVSNEIWRKMLYTYWRLLTSYSITVLLLLYAYQFPAVSNLWEVAGVPENVRQVIGLVQYETTELLFELAIPAFFLIICEIQLHYFHNNFLLLTDADQNRDFMKKEALKKPQYSKKSKTSKYRKSAAGKEISLVKVQVKEAFLTLISFVLLFLEIHLRKIMLITIMGVCTLQVCAVHTIYVLMIVFALLFRRRIQTNILNFVLVFVAFHAVSQMIYQLDVFEHKNFDTICADKSVLNIAEWLGLHKKGKNEHLIVLLKGDIAIFLVSTLLAVLKAHQKYKRISEGLPPDPPRVMFPEITREHADQNIRNCLKYLFNYGFFKYGVEICFMATIALAAYRLEIDSIFYTVWLLILFNMPRKLLSKVWQLYVGYNMMLTVVQYVVAVAYIPHLCFEPLWKQSFGLLKWLIYPEITDSPEPEKIFCYYILLILVCRQKGVFNIEKIYEYGYYPGGNNKGILKEIENPNFVNPIHDHLTTPRSWLDPLKGMLLRSFIWITICAVFLAGSGAIYAIGYFLFAYSFFWKLEELFFYKLSKLTKVWNMLLAYTLCVILCKSILKVFGCLFITELKKHACLLVHMFAITCNEELKISHIYYASDFDPRLCVERNDSEGIVSDGLCFCFLIMTRRLFCSYYFLHHVNESKAEAALASRGADMIEYLRHNRIVFESQKEQETVEKVKIRMERISARAVIPIETDNHFVVSHSGDYYMFEEIDDEAEFMQKLPSKKDEKEQNFLKVIETALKKDMSRAAGLARAPSSSHDQRKVITVAVRPEKEPDEEGEGEGKDENLESDSSDEESEKIEEKTTFVEKMWIFLKFIWALIESLVVTLTRYLNNASHDYYYTMEVLKYRKNLIVIKEAQIQLKKAAASCTPSKREEYERRLQELEMLLKQYQDDKTFTDTELLEMVRSSTISESSEEDDQSDSQKEEEYIFKKEHQPPFVKLFIALKCAVMSHSDLLCYFMVFLYQLKTATVLALPLPLMVLLWGTLSVPRPTKTFWITMITYTEVMVLIKWFFQFHVTFYGSMVKDDPENPLYPPRILGFGIETEHQVFELLLLLVFFYRRSTMVALGLWKSGEEDPVVFKNKIENFIVIDQGDSVLVIPAVQLEVTSAYNIHSTTDSKTSISNATTNEATPLQNFWQEYGSHYVAYNGPEAIMSNVYSTEALEHLPEYIFLVLQKYLSSITQIFKNLYREGERLQVDVYTLIFLCDFVSFLVIAIGGHEFALDLGKGKLLQYIKYSTMPLPYVLVLLTQFSLIIVDRFLYLRKLLLGKIILQIVLIIIVHLWLFFILPAFTGRQIKSGLATQIWYMVKCFYFLLSAYQIRNGYPTHNVGNFLCKHYSIINLIALNGFLMVPFLLEMRCIMDWMWTDTSMTLWEWLKVEEIFLYTFLVKCYRRCEEDYPQARSMKMGAGFKYLMGGFLFFCIAAVIWFPLLFYSLGHEVGKTNIPAKISVELEINGQEPIYEMQRSHLTGCMSPEHWELLETTYIKNTKAMNILKAYDHTDVAVIRMNAASRKFWDISESALESLKNDISNEEHMSIRFSWVITPQVPYTTAKQVSGERQYTIPLGTSAEKNPLREQLLNILKNYNATSNTNNSIIIPYIIPKFLQIGQTGDAKPLTQFMDRVVYGEENIYRSIELRLNHSQATNQMWWEIRETCDDYNYDMYLRIIAPLGCQKLVFFTFSDRIFPESLSVITNMGIIGLYLGFVYITYKFVRGFVTNAFHNIMYLDTPNVDPILQLCEDLYLVREHHLYDLEELLYAKLIFLFRSPETRIRFTRYATQRLPENGKNEQSES